jgi:aryl carrier-like protein
MALQPLVEFGAVDIDPATDLQQRGLQSIRLRMEYRKRLTTATLRERAKDRILGARGSGVSEQLRRSGFGRHM